MPFFDARQMDSSVVLRADVCVVGAGAAGLAIAKEFAGRGLRIALLESGDFSFRHRTQFLYWGENIGRESVSTVHSRFRMFGGSTTRWSGQCRPLDAIDFEARKGIPYSGWPFGLDHLEPHYRRAQEFCNLGPYDYTASAWARDGDSMLPVDSPELDTKIFQFGFPSDLGRVYRTTLESAPNIQVYLNANVVAIDLDEYSRNVTGLRIATFNGKRLSITAGAYVLACGGIENPRLLLASDRVMQNGVGNHNDLVGRFFMDHPYLLLGHFEPSADHRGRTLYTIEDYALVGKEQKANAAFALNEQTLREEGINNCVLYFVRRPNYKTRPEYFSVGGKSFAHLVDVLRHQEIPDQHFGRHIKNAIGGLRDVGVSLARQAAELAKPQPRLGLRAVLETTPQPNSRVTLGDRRDHFGVPRVRINWALNPEDQRGLTRLLAALRGEFSRLHLGHLVEDHSTDEAGWPRSMTGGKHHMGTTRMHVDPRQGVVDANCRVHGLSNLYIAGSSVFPTGGYANPTLTIVALAIRLADHVKAQLGAGAKR